MADNGYTEYVTTALPWLRRTAYLLCGDVHGADDVVQIAITRLYTNWRKARAAENLDACVRAIVVRTSLNERRRSWSKVQLSDQADVLQAAALNPDVETREDVRVALTRIPPGQLRRSGAAVPVRPADRRGRANSRMHGGNGQEPDLSRSHRVAHKAGGDGVMSEVDGVRLIGSLRTVEVPASNGVSVERAIRAGKRTRTLRITAVGVFVLILAGVLPLMIRPVGGPTAAGPAGPESFDPMIRTISVGAVAGLRPTQYITGRDLQHIWLEPEGNGDQLAQVHVYAAGRWHQASGESIPDINGKRALWSGDAVMVEWARDSWAAVRIEGFTDDRERAVRVARSLTFDEHIEILVPYTVETSWKLNRVFDDEGDIQLEFTNNVRVYLRGNTGLTYGDDALQAERDALAKSVRPADPPVANPFR